MTNKSKKIKTFVDLLEDDHKKVKALFKRFEKSEDENEKREIVQTTLKALLVHTQIEEEVLYPALREFQVIEDVLVDEAYVEHNVAKNLMQELSDMSPEDEYFDAKFTVLGEVIEHHIEEEEEEIFPKAEKKLDSEAITAQLQGRKLELEEGESRKAA